MDTEITHSIGSRIVELRKALKKSQTDFAELLQTSIQTIGNIEKNRTEPAFRNIQSLAQAIPSLNLRWLIFGQGKMLESAYQNQSEAGFLILQEKPAHYESMGANKSETDPTVAQLRREIELLKGMVEDKETIIQLLKKNQQ